MSTDSLKNAIFKMCLEILIYIIIKNLNVYKKDLGINYCCRPVKGLKERHELGIT